jgi:hypothetical protein
LTWVNGLIRTLARNVPWSLGREKLMLVRPVLTTADKIIVEFDFMALMAMLMAICVNVVQGRSGPTFSPKRHGSLQRHFATIVGQKRSYKKSGLTLKRMKSSTSSLRSLRAGMK